MSTKYNGWTNRETWLVGLWLGDMLEDVAMECENEAEFIERLKDWLDECNPLTGESSIFSDLIGGAIAIINWWEIADHYTEFWTNEDDDEEEDDE